MSAARRDIVLTVLRDELTRQAAAGQLDLPALADAIEAAIVERETPPGAPDPDGKEPDELNASNDI